jgi:putative SOS response-associated peptidase YedK
MRRVFALIGQHGQPAFHAGIFPDQLAPVVRSDREGARELIRMRWGFPPPPNLGTQPVTNVRNSKSPYWRGWLKPEFRCLVPLTSFCEYTDERPKVPHWFAVDESRPWLRSPASGALDRHTRHQGPTC